MTTAGFADRLSRIAGDLAGLPDAARYCGGCRTVSQPQMSQITVGSSTNVLVGSCFKCGQLTVSVAQARRDVERAAAWVSS